MPKERLIISLVKVLIAAAWADGEISHEEINSLKDLLFQLPEMTANDWARLDMYIESPVDEAECARLIDELKGVLNTPADRALTLVYLDQLVAADGQVSDDELEAVGEITTAIEEVNTGIFGQFGRLLRGPVQRRSQAVALSPNRESDFEDFVRNKVFYHVRHRLESSGDNLEVSDAILRKLCLAGGLMARVAFVDWEITEDEFKTMVAVLQKGWDISQSEAVIVTEVAVSEIGKTLDYYRMTRQFFSLTSEAERLAFLDVLFTVAAGDGRASHEEIEEIRMISNVLKLTHQQFIQAKLKLPREKRAD